MIHLPIRYDDSSGDILDAQGRLLARVSFTATDAEGHVVGRAIVNSLNWRAVPLPDLAQTDDVPMVLVYAYRWLERGRDELAGMVRELLDVSDVPAETREEAEALLTLYVETTP